MKKEAHYALALNKAQKINETQKTNGDKACSVILQGIGDVPPATTIKHIEDPQELWNALSERYAGILTFNETIIQTSLSKPRYSGQDMEMYISEYEQLAAKLDAMNFKMYESLLIGLFLL